MQNIITKIDRLKALDKTPKLNSAAIIEYQKYLIKHKIAMLPEAYLELLRYCNGLRYNDACLCGIYPQTAHLSDIFTLNLQIHHPLQRDLIILGFNEFDYLAYNQKWNVYQIIDKDDLEVLEEYQQLEQALNYILKI